MKLTKLSVQCWCIVAEENCLSEMIVLRDVVVR